MTRREELIAFMKRMTPVAHDPLAQFVAEMWALKFMREFPDFEKAHAPTDDEQEAAQRLLSDVNPQHRPAIASMLSDDIRIVASAVIRKVRTAGLEVEPSDAQVQRFIALVKLLKYDLERPGESGVVLMPPYLIHRLNQALEVVSDA